MLLRDQVCLHSREERGDVSLFVCVRECERGWHAALHSLSEGEVCSSTICKLP
jgi:hypothetical protein